MHPITCHVLSYVTFSFLLCPLLGIFSFDLWAFKKAQFKRNFLCEVSLIPPNLRAPLLVLILPFIPQGMDHVSLISAASMPSKVLAPSGGLVHDSWINKCIVRVVILGFVELVLTSNIHPTYDKQFKDRIASQERQTVNKCFSKIWWVS